MSSRRLVVLGLGVAISFYVVHFTFHMQRALSPSATDDNRSNENPVVVDDDLKIGDLEIERRYFERKYSNSEKHTPWPDWKRIVAAQLKFVDSRRANDPCETAVAYSEKLKSTKLAGNRQNSALRAWIQFFDHNVVPLLEKRADFDKKKGVVFPVGIMDFRTFKSKEDLDMLCLSNSDVKNPTHPLAPPYQHLSLINNGRYSSLDKRCFNDRYQKKHLPDGRKTKPVFRGSMRYVKGMPRNATVGELTSFMLHKFERLKLADISRHHPSVLDAKMSSIRPRAKSQSIWSDAKYAHFSHQFLSNLDQIPREDYFCGYQTVYVIGDIGASTRTIAHFSANQTVIFQDYRLQEWYASYLIPWIHYVPLDEKLHRAVPCAEWAIKYPLHALKIAANGRTFFNRWLDRNATAHFVAEYAVQLSKMQNFEVALANIRTRLAPKNLTALG